MAQAAPADLPPTDQFDLNETTNTSNENKFQDESDSKTSPNKMKIHGQQNKDHNSHIQIEGWLLKKSRVLKKWRRRWIVLSGNHLCSYKNEKGYSSDPTETINLNDIISIKAQQENNNNKFSFEIELNKKLTFTLAADSLTYRDLWLSELNKIITLNSTMHIIKEKGKNGNSDKIISFGCEHIRRNNSILCSCCNKWYFCSYCHDSNESGFINSGHELERKNIVAMKCCKCGKEQSPNKYCIKCKLIMGKYFCDKCQFWDNNFEHMLYHCDKCGVCRSGNKSDYIHCDKCGVCLNKQFYINHKCMEQSTHCDCPICGCYLHISDKPVTFWSNCTHAIHVKCMEEYLVYDTLCPICREPWIP